MILVSSNAAIKVKKVYENVETLSVMIVHWTDFTIQQHNYHMLFAVLIIWTYPRD